MNTITISATDIAKVLLERPYIMLKKNGKQIYALDVVSIETEGNGYDLLHGSGRIVSLDRVYELINTIRTSSVSASELEKANRRYRTFDKKGMNSTVIGVDRPMDIALNKAGVTEYDIISVNLSDVYSKALASKSKRAMENTNLINIAANTYGVRIYDERLYAALNGWVNGSTIVELYDVEMKKTYLDAETNKGLSLSKTFMPSVRTSSMKNAGEKFFILDSKVEDFERALCCGLSLRDRFNQLSNNGLLPVSTKQIVKEWKYLPSSIAGRTKLDLSKCRIAVINQKGRVGDGNGSAKPGLINVPDKTALQMRVRVYQGKGMLLCEEETFARDLKYLNKVATVHPEMITYYGDPSLPVGVIVDRNFIKMLDGRLEVVPEDERTSWIIHEFGGELSRSEMSIDECSKWLRRCTNDTDKKTIMDMFIRGFERGLKKKTLACFTPDTEGNYLPSMLKGIDKWSTIKSLDSMFGKLWSADCRPTAWMGGYTLGLTQHPVFRDPGAAYRGTRGKEGLAIIFLNTETWEKLGRPTEAVLTKFPSPSERGAVRVAVRINDHVCNNCIGLDMSKESAGLLEAMSGADCDGDKCNVMSTVINKDGNNIRTWLGKILENANYRHMTVKNILPEMAETATVDSVLEMHIKDIGSAAGMTGVMISAMNIIKLNAKGNPDAEAYVGRFEHITEMRTEDILAWMIYVGQNGCNVKIDDTNRTAWWLDCGLIQDWLAEFTTSLSGSGVPMPDDIRNFFCAFKDSIVTYWATSIEESNKAIIEYNKTAEKKKLLIELNKDKLVRRLTIANPKLYEAVEAKISECDQWAHKRITEIKWVSDNAVSLAEFRKDHPKMAIENIDVRFGYVGNYMPDEYKRYGFGHISAASHNLENSEVWKHWAGTFAAAQDYRRTKKETNGEYSVRLLRVAELCNATWNKSKYSTMFMVSRYVRQIGYNITDEVALSYEKEYEGKYALPIVLMNSDKKNDYTTTLAEIKSGNIVTGTIKGDRFVVESTINGKNKNVGLQIATESDLLINGLNLRIEQLVNARIDDVNHKEYYVALCTIVD